MATSFVDRAGYRHTAHSTIRAQIIRHQVWTSDAEGWYIGLRSLSAYPAGHPAVPEGTWVLTSDYSPAPVRFVSAATARRILEAWNAAGAGFLWQDAALANLTSSAEFQG